MTRRSLQVLAVLLALLVSDAAVCGDWRADSHHIWMKVHRHKKYDEALKLGDKMLTHYQTPAQLKSIGQFRAEANLKRKQVDKAIEDARALADGVLAKKHDLLADVYFGYAYAFDRHRQGKRSITFYEMVLEKCPDSKGQCARARIAAGDHKQRYIKNGWKQAIEEYATVERDYPTEAKYVPTALRKMADLYMHRLRDPKNAELNYGKIVKQYIKDLDPKTQKHVAWRLGESREQLKDHKGAYAAYTDAAKWVTDAPSLQDLAWRRANIRFAQQDYAKAVDEFLVSMTKYGMANESRSKQAARSVMDSYFMLKKYDEAIRAARVVYDWSDQHAAVYKIAEILKLQNGKAEKVRPFALFQMHGAKGPDGKGGTLNLLSTIGYPKYPAHIEQGFAKAMKSYGDTWRDWQKKGKLYMVWGKPREAGKCLFRALRMCDSLRDAVRIGQELIGGPVRALRGTSHGITDWYDYLISGKRPPDFDSLKDIFSVSAKVDKSPQIAEALKGLEEFLLEPFPSARDSRHEIDQRGKLLGGYARIAMQAGQHDKLNALCEKLLADKGQGNMHGHVISSLCTTLRARDGHFGAVYALIGKYGKTRGNHSFNNTMNWTKRELGGLTNWRKRYRGPDYRRLAPPPPKKKPPKKPKPKKKGKKKKK